MLVQSLISSPMYLQTPSTASLLNQKLQSSQQKIVLIYQFIAMSPSKIRLRSVASHRQLCKSIVLQVCRPCRCHPPLRAGGKWAKGWQRTLARYQIRQESHRQDDIVVAASHVGVFRAAAFYSRWRFRCSHLPFLPSISPPGATLVAKHRF